VERKYEGKMNGAKKNFFKEERMVLKNFSFCLGEGCTESGEVMKQWCIKE